MKSKQRPIVMPLVMSLLITLCGAFSLLRADVGTCGSVNITLPFTDVAGNAFFCQIAAAYFSGLTNGTTATTYSPGNNVTREQMAAFITRTLDQSLERGSRRAALNQFWTTRPLYLINQGVTALGNAPRRSCSDGTDVWVTSNGEIYRVRASDGKLLGTWTGATSASGVLCAMGRVFATGDNKLYLIDPTAPPGAVTTVNSGLGSFNGGIAFDGFRIWTANNDSVSYVFASSNPNWPAVNVSGLGNLNGIIYDGANIWVTVEGSPGSLKKLDSEGVVLQTVTVGNNPQFPIFDGTNIWVPNYISDSVTVVRAATGAVVATLVGNALNGPTAAAFDGERILVTSLDGDKVSLWKAADLTPLGSQNLGAGTQPLGACSDGQYFWLTLQGTNQLARF